MTDRKLMKLDGYADCPQFNARPDRLHRVVIFPDGLTLEIVVVKPSQ